MTVLSKRMAFPPSGGASWPAGQGPMWRGGAANGWWHPKAVLALDSLNGRYAREGVDLGQATAVLATTRSSIHLLADVAGVLRSFAVNVMAAVAGAGAFIGGQVTNLLACDCTSGNPGYSIYGSGSFTTWVNNWVIDDYTMGGAQIRRDNAVGYQGFYKNVSVASGQLYTLIVRARCPAGVTASSVTYSAGFAGGASGGLASNAALTADWQWFKAEITATSSSGGMNIYSASGAVGAGFDIAEMHLLAGKWGSALNVPIISSTFGMTRYASDVAAVPSGDDPFPGYTAAGLRPAASVLAAVNLTHVGDGALRPVTEISDGTTGNRLRLYVDTDGKPAAQVLSGGATLATAKLASALTTGRTVLAANFDPANGLYLVRKSGLQSAFASLSGMPANLASLRVGSGVTGNYLNDVIEQVQVCSVLTQAEADAWVAAA